MITLTTVETTEELEPSDSKNLAETSGQGEEGESTLFECRAKLHKLSEGKYNPIGLGIFKIKSGEKKRLLMRQEGNGNVVLVRIQYLAEGLEYESHK